MQIIFLNYSIFLPFFTFSETLSAFRQIFFGEVAITAFFVSIGTYWGKTKLDFSEKVQTLYPSRRLQGKFRRGGQDCIHRYNRIFMQTIFLNYMFFYHFCTLSEKFSGFDRQLFSEVVITAFFVSIGTYSGKIKDGFFEKSKSFISFLETGRKTPARW